MRSNKVLLVTIILWTFIFTPLSYSQDEFETTTIRCGGVNLIVEIAADYKSRDKGLMHRETLPDGEGMLFVYPKKTTCKLWMKNTFVPLSAAFIDDDGRIMQIIYMKKTNSAKIYRSKEKAKYALEVPLGWFQKNGVKIGDYCIITDIPSR